MNKDNLYLKRAKLSGYKSIIDTDISFKDGLNIIIGKNAAGKTNFLKFLFEVLYFSFNDLISFSSELSFEGSQRLQINSNTKIKQKEFINTTRISKSEVDTTITVNKKTTRTDHNQNIDSTLRKNNISFSPSIIVHGIPKNYYFVNTPFSFTTDKEGLPSELIQIAFDNDTPYFVKNIVVKFIALSVGNINNDIDKVKEILLDSFKEINIIKGFLTKFSPVEDIRLNENINIFFDQSSEDFTINNIFIEFKIQDTWHPFNNLSDGTKRLFYIISEVASSSKLHYSSSSFSVKENESDNKRIILIEEPELGIHPHQLMALMEFLKIQSKTKQIIITSHSPIILDVLNEDELDRIIVASMTDKKEGTILKHIGETEKAKAKKYMQENFLSDYWKYSDLEK